VRRLCWNPDGAGGRTARIAVITDRSEEGRRALVQRAALALVFALTVLLALRQVDSLDVGFHLKAGNHVLDGRGWPRTDPFSFTMREHRYVDTSWGYQVLIAAVERLGGAGGLVLLHAALVLGVFVLLWRTALLEGVDRTVLAALLFLGALASEMRFAVRPELVSYLLLAGLLHLLHRHAHARGAPLALLPVLFLVWANVHSLFVLGWGALACVCVGLALRRGAIDRPLVLWSLASVAVTLVNPYGWRGVFFPFTLLTRFRESNPFHAEIGEFVSPFDAAALEERPFYPWIPVQAFRLLVVLGGLAFVVLLVRRRWACALLLLVFAVPAVSMIRNTPLLVVAGLPAIAWGLSFGGPALRGARTALAGLVAALALLLGLRVASDAYYVDVRREERFGLGWNDAVLPIDAARYVERSGIDGPPLNHLNFGGWLMWALDQPTFIDGRLEVVGEDFYREYRAATSSQEALEACVARWGIRWLIFPYANFPQLLGRMSSDARWKLAYADHLAAIFVRDEPGVSRFIAPELPGAAPGEPLALEGLPGFARGAPRPSRLARWVAGLTARARFPRDEHYSGLFHLYRGELERSAERFAAAIRASGGRYFEHYANLGAVLYRMRRWPEAAACYRIVLAERPDDALAQRRLAEITRAGGR
jgi:hypothetical protein